MAQGTDGKTCDNRPRQSDREAPKTCQILLRTHFAPTTIPTTYHSPNLSNEQIRYINSSILQGGTVAVNTFDDNTQITKPQAPAKDANGKDDKDANKEPKERPLDLTHDEIMIDLFFVLTILKSCIDIDKRLSSYLTRIVSPNLSGNLHLRSLAQPRLDSIRSSLESKQQQYLQSYAVYISYCFDSILKLVPSGYYKVKSVDNVGGTTKTTALWIQAAKLLESASSAIIASLSGLNVDDFLHSLQNRLWIGLSSELARLAASHNLALRFCSKTLHKSNDQLTVSVSPKSFSNSRI
jgi:hypothetical protein